MKWKCFLLPWKYPLEHRRFGSHVLQGSKFSASNQNSPFSVQIFAVNRWWLQSTPNLITHSISFVGHLPWKKAKSKQITFYAIIFWRLWQYKNLQTSFSCFAIVLTQIYRFPLMQILFIWILTNNNNIYRFRHYTLLPYSTVWFFNFVVMIQDLTIIIRFKIFV